MADRRLWVYKCSRRSRQQGDWSYFFQLAAKGPREWGGTWSTSSGAALKEIRRVKRGDLVLCYQSDERAIVGIARVHEITKDDDEFSLVLRKLEVFPDPYITRGSAQIKQIKAFRRGGAGSSMFAGTTPSEARRLLRWCGARTKLG